MKPGFEDVVQEIESEINCKMEQLNWLPGFYSIPPHVHIARSKAYQQGKVRERESNQSSSILMSKPSLIPSSSLWDGLFQMYGIDAASGAAVSALGISPGDHVLDLCAAPGHHSLHSLFLIP